MRYLYLTFIFLLGNNVWGQPDEPIRYPLPDEIGTNVPEGQKVGYYKEKALLHAQIGNYEKALEFWDATLKPQPDISGLELEKFQSYRAKYAKTYIGEKAEDVNIVMVNELSCSPAHRAFTISLLYELKQRGYTYFATDALNGKDDSLSIRKYPLGSSGNKFLAEPLYGDIVRVALRMGFEVVPLSGSPGSTPDRQAAEKARPIHGIFRKERDAKIIIHVGFVNTMEKPPSGWNGTLASYLKLLTGKDPLTIDQTSMAEHSSTALENPYYRDAEPRLYGQTSVMLDAGGHPFVEPKKKGIFDLQIFHPRTEYKNNRPVWMDVYKLRKEYVIDFKKLGVSTFPCLVQAFAEGEEGENLIPVDQIYVEKGPYYDKGERKTINQTALFLPKGTARIKILSTSGKVLFDNSVTLK